MKILLSPAKTMDLQSDTPVEISTSPVFIEQAKALHSTLKKKSPKELMKLMRINSKLAHENWQRNQEWNPHPKAGEGLQAFLIFKGEVYRGLAAPTLPSNSYDYLKNNLKILSGLYGILNAFDFIMPYRLEMGTALKYRRKNNIYEFWGDQITQYLNSICQEGEPILNLSSNEYAKVIDVKKLKAHWIEVDFKDERNGKLMSIMTYFKNARGVMARTCAINKIETIEELQSMEIDGYLYKKELSTPHKWVYVR